jgi:hypothetical protein
MDIGMQLFELARKLLHHDHVAIVDGRHREVGIGAGGTCRDQPGEQGKARYG